MKYTIYFITIFIGAYFWETVILGIFMRRHLRDSVGVNSGRGLISSTLVHLSFVLTMSMYTYGIFKNASAWIFVPVLLLFFGTVVHPISTFERHKETFYPTLSSKATNIYKGIVAITVIGTLYLVKQGLLTTGY